MEIWMLSNLNPSSFRVSGWGGLCHGCPIALHFKPFFSFLSFFSPLFDVVTPNLSPPWQTNERPAHVWQLISLAGGKQLDTANGGRRRRRRGGSDMKSMRQSCICGREGLCESISKMIHFAVATHFRLPLPITAVSGEGDRASRGVARGRFCLICHQRPGDPHPLSCPLPTHSSIFSPIHQAHLRPAQEPQRALERGKGPHCSSWLTVSPAVSLWGPRHWLHTLSVRETRGQERWLACTKPTQFPLRKIMIFKTSPHDMGQGSRRGGWGLKSL